VTAPAAPRTWSISTTTGLTVSGHLPPWATEDPSETGVPADQLPRRLADLNHHAPFDGLTLQVSAPGHPNSHEPFFRGGIDCDPYADPPDPRIPVAHLEVLPDYWLHDLTPADLTTLSDTLRTLAALLESTLHPALTRARHDWSTHHATTP
jgi:hypothetical protein